jgi:hypothetical protein
MIKDIQTASFFLKDGLNDNSSFRWCFCPGDEGGPGDAEAGSGGYGGVADEDIGSGVDDSLSVDEARGVVEAEAASRAQTAALSQAQRDAANQMSLFDPTIDVAFNLDPSLVDRQSLNELQQNYFNMLDDVAAVDSNLAQDLLDARSINTPKYGIYNPEAMNKLENRGLRTFGLGYRGAFEARSGKGQTRASYSPNDLTGAGTDERSYNMAMFQSFAKANPNLTTVEAVAQHNAESPTLSISINDVQSMGFDLNAPVGPQADFREAVAQRGVAQGIGLMAAGPMTGLATIATDGKGVMGLVAEELGIKDKLDKLDVLPSYQDLALDVFGPSKDTMQPGSFGISPTTADLSTPTDSQIGYTDMGLGSFAPDGNEFSQLPISIQTQTAPVQEVQVAEKDAPRFPVRDTTPDSVIRTLGQIYKDAEGNPDEKRARELLGIGIA